MQTVRNAWVKQGRDNLFTDHYGILKLAAHATLTKTSDCSRIASYLRLKWVQWVNSILAVIKQLWQSNTITFFDFIWLDPDVFVYAIIDEAHAKTTKKSVRPFNRSGKEINYKLGLKNVYRKNGGKKSEKQPSIIGYAVKARIIVEE
mgnify:CR=1 FL=1